MTEMCNITIELVGTVGKPVGSNWLDLLLQICISMLPVDIAIYRSC
jgi:hypothetical protein